MILLDTIQSQRNLDSKIALASSPSSPASAAVESAAAKSSANYLAMDDVYTIRRNELRSDDQVRVQFYNNVRKRYLGSQGNAADFYAGSEAQQALGIVQTGDPNLAKDVHPASDPRVMLEFRNRVQPRILAGCAAAGCHGGDGSGGFFLYFDAKETLPAYTNFYILQETGRTLEGGDTFGNAPVYRPMIDRLHPDSSLILQFGLPRSMAATPHPDVHWFKPIFRGVKDPAFLEISRWISSMAPIRLTTGLSSISPPARRRQRGVRDVAPVIYLLFLLAILFAAIVAGAMSRFRRRRKLRICARRWNMHFAPGDRLRLARRIAEQFPVIGAANISVRDLLFRNRRKQAPISVYGGLHGWGHPRQGRAIDGCGVQRAGFTRQPDSFQSSGAFAGAAKPCGAGGV